MVKPNCRVVECVSLRAQKVILAAYEKERY